MRLSIPDLSLVVLIGVSSAGKSTFAREHFLPTEVLSADFFRGVVADDENSLEATDDAFAALHFVAARRLARGLLTVVDATNVQPEARKPLVELAKRYHAQPVAIVFDLPQALCEERAATRTDRDLPPHVIPRQYRQLRRGLKGLKREGFRRTFALRSPADVARVETVREKLWPDRREERGPFDIIGDVHGCCAELEALLDQLGYRIAGEKVEPPPGRKAVFVGDLVDRGPNAPGVLALVMRMVESGAALCVPGNHDARLVRALQGRKVQRTHGLEETLTQLAGETAEFKKKVETFLGGLVSHYVLDGGALVVAHAGMKEEMAGRASGAVRAFALYGDVTGEEDEFGLPVRRDWAAEYRGRARVVYGHTPVAQPEWVNNAINIDTGCVFGGALTALRYPELELVSVPAKAQYSEPVRPLTAQQTHDDVLDLADVAGGFDGSAELAERPSSAKGRRVETRLMGRVFVHAERAAAALEVMSRFAVDHRWLVYLPPTMAPPQTSTRPDLLEHPDEVLAYYRRCGVRELVCEEKQMGSRAVLVVCRDPATAQRRFGIEDGSAGICYTRTGRRFFTDAGLEAGILDHVRRAFERSELWHTLATDWAILDAEVMPWSAKAQQLLEDQYAAVGAAARMSLAASVGALEQAAARGVDVGELLSRCRIRAESVAHYAAAYRPYCWPVHSLKDLKVAPFHLLATEGQVHVNQTHAWHLETLDKLCAAGPDLLCAIDRRRVILDDMDSSGEVVRWWEELTANGSEGFVAKPLDFVCTGERGLVQPALKCRGRAYLRLIYGPEYTERLELLRRRSLKGKQALALREFALGVEGLERFVAGQPLRRIHECVFGVLALESAPVDPRF
ncbi:MAG: polynucleotide kinase-phosphatase [Gemmatimonadetes bacterium]|nr:polynucleotide kinase-phosphatase [Gemmatimonadota bacterium]